MAEPAATSGSAMSGANTARRFCALTGLTVLATLGWASILAANAGMFVVCCLWERGLCCVEVKNEEAWREKGEALEEHVP